MTCDWECDEYRDRVEAELARLRQQVAELTAKLAKRDIELLNTNMMLNRSIGIGSHGEISMSLQTLVASRIDLTDAEIVAELNALTVTKTDAQRTTWAGLALRFGPTIIGTIDEVLKAVSGMDWIRMQLAGGGIDFSAQITQDALEGLRAVPQLADHIDNLKSVGRWSISPYQDDGGTGEVAEEQVAAVHADLITRREAGAYWSRVLAVVNPMLDAGNTSSEIKVAASEVV